MSLLSQIAAILFVGHSLVGSQMPAMVEGALRHGGADTRVERQIINGAPLRYNWDHSAEAEGVDARAFLPEAAPDVVVLTEAVPLKGNLRYNDSAKYAARFRDLAVAANPAAQVFLYETWHSINSGTDREVEHDPGADVPWRERLDQDLALWESIVDEVNDARRDTAPPMRLIPAGQAMARAHDAIAEGGVPGLGTIVDLFSDDIHLNDRGNYLVAMVHYAAITGQSPEGLPARLTRRWESRETVVTPEMAAALQRIAWQTVVEYQAGAEIAGLPEREAPPPPAQTPVVMADVEIDAPPAGEAPAPVTNPNLALGLNGINDWSTQAPFLDVMKSARPWIGHLPGQWGGWGHDELAAGGYLDADGWPLVLPDALAGIATLILTDLPPEATMLAGRYRVTYAGDGQLQIGGRAQNVRQRPGEAWFDFTPGEDGVLLTITATGGPKGHLRDIRVVKETQIAAYEAGEVFNPDWISVIRGVRGVRFMDWMMTNGATLADWGDRPRPGDYTYARIGAPAEVMVALANTLNADPWFTLPHLASDDFIRRFAELVRDGLDPGLKAYVEFSNEVWNWQFAQTHWAEEAGRARWGRDGTWVQYYAMRASRMADIWAEVFGAEADERLVRVIGVQAGWSGLEEDILMAPLWVAEAPGEITPPAEHFDAYAVTGYFSAQLGTDAKAAMVRRWLRDSREAAEAQATAQNLSGQARAHFVAAHRFDLATTRAAAELRDGAESGVVEDSLHHLLTEVLPYHAAAARAYGLDLVMYEGGTHVVGAADLIEDEELAAFYQHLNYSAEMGALYRVLLAGWRDLTDAPFNAFVDVASPSKWGSWGALRHLGDGNPRWSALAGFE